MVPDRSGDMNAPLLRCLGRCVQIRHRPTPRETVISRVMPNYVRTSRPVLADRGDAKMDRQTKNEVLIVTLASLVPIPLLAEAVA
jgi:hypothetical protein